MKIKGEVHHQYLSLGVMTIAGDYDNTFIFARQPSSCFAEFLDSPDPTPGCGSHPDDEIECELVGQVGKRRWAFRLSWKVRSSGSREVGWRVSFDPSVNAKKVKINSDGTLAE